MSKCWERSETKSKFYNLDSLKMQPEFRVVQRQHMYSNEVQGMKRLFLWAIKKIAIYVVQQNPKRNDGMLFVLQTNSHEWFAILQWSELIANAVLCDAQVFRLCSTSCLVMSRLPSPSFLAIFFTTPRLQCHSHSCGYLELACWESCSLLCSSKETFFMPKSSS